LRYDAGAVAQSVAAKWGSAGCKSFVSDISESGLFRKSAEIADTSAYTPQSGPKADIAGDSEKWIGKSIERVEDEALVTGRGRFIDDLGTRPGTLAAAILRSPHAHAELEAVDCNAARAVDGVAAVITATEVRALTSSLVVGVKAPLECWPIAIDRVRYVGEPVAVVVALDRYRAEDALELIDVRYRQLPAVVDTLAATLPNAPLLHPAVGTNVVGERTFCYGNPRG
jgi:2-furoyl-CoA dehydrogenase large subunit